MSHNYTLIHYTPGTELPEPWQPDWQVADIGTLPSIPERRVARAPQGTPVPAGGELYTEPVVTDEHRALASRDITYRLTQWELEKPVADIAKSIARSEWQEACLPTNAAELEVEIKTRLGLAHPYTRSAPLNVTTLEEAVHQYLAADALWDSRCSCALVRCAEKGYHVWRGIGTLLESLGNADTYEQAEKMAVEGIAAKRDEVVTQMREVLVGWSDDTPFGSLTLATLHRRPWSLRRGPVTAEEMGSSWDLPVVAEYLGTECIGRHDERVTWSDDESRTRQRAARRAGQRRHDAETAEALRRFAECPALTGRVGQKGLTRGALPLRNGMTVELVGPVRMRNDGACPLALVREQSGRRYWMALGSFA